MSDAAERAGSSPGLVVGLIANTPLPKLLLLFIEIGAKLTG